MQQFSLTMIFSQEEHIYAMISRDTSGMVKNAKYAPVHNQKPHQEFFYAHAVPIMAVTAVQSKFFNKKNYKIY